MSYTEKDRFSHPAGSEAEATLRLIASLPSPAGLEERVQAGLRNAPRTAHVLAWPAAMGSGGWLRGAAAAAIVMVVAGGSWGIYARVGPGVPGHGVGGPRMGAAGSFSEGGAERRPHTLVGPVAPAPAAAAATPKAASRAVAPLAVKTKAPLSGRATAAHAAPAQ